MGFLRHIWVKKVAHLPDEILRTYGEAIKDTLDSVTVSCMTWNAHKGNGDGFSEEFTRLPACDLQCIQEASDYKPMVDAFNADHGVGYQMAVSFWGLRNVATGVATGCEAHPKWVGFEQTTDHEPFIQTPKTILITRYGWQTRELLVLNIHGINFTSTESFKAQLNQASPHIANHVGPVLFMGDFNVRNSERDHAIREWAAQNGMMHEDGLEALGAREYDRILYRGLKVTSVRVLKDFKSSNHFPIVFDITAVD